MSSRFTALQVSLQVFMQVHRLLLSNKLTAVRHSPATSDSQRAQFRKLLSNRQVEFVNGGWVMQDEIASNYDADINQMTLGKSLYTPSSPGHILPAASAPLLYGCHSHCTGPQGHKWILDNFGLEYMPKVAWHIDPQGHVGATAARFAAMGCAATVGGTVPCACRPLSCSIEHSDQSVRVRVGWAEPTLPLLRLGLTLTSPTGSPTLSRPSCSRQGNSNSFGMGWPPRCRRPGRQAPAYSRTSW